MKPPHPTNKVQHLSVHAAASDKGKGSTLPFNAAACSSQPSSPPNHQSTWKRQKSIIDTSISFCIHACIIRNNRKQSDSDEKYQ
jgi:hypothetical protein